MYFSQKNNSFLMFSYNHLDITSGTVKPIQFDNGSYPPLIISVVKNKDTAETFNNHQFLERCNISMINSTFADYSEKKGLL